MISLRGLHPNVRARAEWAHAIARYYGFTPTVTSGYRTWEAQKRLRARWERGESQFPANRPGDSAHNYGLAWDSVVKPEDRPFWEQIRRYAGFDVPANDWIHGEVPSWRQYVS